MMPVDANVKKIIAQPLTAEAFQKYGQVVSVPRGDDGQSANNNTAKRFNFLGNVQNLRSDAKANMCVFRCQPVAMPFHMRMLEKHQYSNQMFSPMNAQRYLVIVSLGGDEPDLQTLAAFVADGTQAINYNAGCWHHPMIALDTTIDFTCFVHENGTKDDCTVTQTKEQFFVHI
ncbi:ureidoglycolate lyaseA [Acrasis kona]|uniref:Ureidoglycolate lyaseA n=1 Tax=Acrasis kona TaxID=1008807 RepID=A0AAW2Z7A9_9EUKA